MDVRSGSLLSLETPAVMISTPSLSPLKHKQHVISMKLKKQWIWLYYKYNGVTYSVWGNGMTLWGLTFMASALWVIRRCHLVKEKKKRKSYHLYTFNNGGNKNVCHQSGVKGLTFSDLRPWVPSARRSGLRCPTWIGRRRTCCLAGENVQGEINDNSVTWHFRLDDLIQSGFIN